VATAYHPARNAAESAYRFDVHPEDLARIVTGIEAAGSELVAVFHSHPRSDPVPSATDRREARYRVPHLIATLRVTSASSGAALRAWSMEPSAPVEVPLVIG
jgi:proteasome lid subunit RPN8/RPN11